ncbi:metal ABC transporter permease [Deferribacteraceae bacterium V6Fe1]|nr:metal ABC transporter permease [Deferribacteraceae bacterium V6Fe1]
MEIFQYDFFLNAIYTVLLASIVCGIAGALIVVNQMVFLTGAVAHAAYGGVGLAFFFGLPVLPTTLVFSLLSSSALGVYTANKTYRVDSVIGIFWALGMALGIILIDFTPGYKADLMSYLFGSLIAVSQSDINMIFILDVIAILFLVAFYQKLVLFSFDKEFAYVKGINISLIHTLIIILASISIVILIKVVGLILVVALLTIPQHLAENKSNNLFQMIIISTVYTLFFGLSGLLFSYYFNTTSGASIILVASFWFVIEKFLAVLKNAWYKKTFN